MKNFRLLFLLIFIAPINIFSRDIFLIDKIEAVIYAPQETSIITKSELDRPGLDGQYKNTDQLVLEQLVYQDAKKYNIIDEKMVDNYISAIQRQNNITLDDIKAMFKEAGYTYEEGRDQLSIVNAVNSMLDFKVRSKLIIPEKQAREYYDANPVFQEGRYKLQRIFIPFGDEKEKKIEKRIMRQLKLGQDIVGAQYSDEFWVEGPDLSEDKQFIKDMSVGQISAPEKLDDGFELFKLVDKKAKMLVPFEDRYNEIADVLRKPMYEKLFEEYKKSLYDNAVIVNFD